MILYEFLHSNIYNKYISTLEKEMTISIDKNSTFYKNMMGFYDMCLNEAAVTIDDLNWLIAHYPKETINYIIRKYNTFLEPDGGKDNIKNLPPLIDFPIIHLIEFFLILKDSSNIKKYIKFINIPKSKSYMFEINRIFNESNQKKYDIN